MNSIGESIRLLMRCKNRRCRSWARTQRWTENSLAYVPIRNIRSQRFSHLSLKKLGESKSRLSESQRRACPSGYRGSLPLESIFNIPLSLCVVRLQTQNTKGRVRLCSQVTWD